jgi:hypothetical protein
MTVGSLVRIELNGCLWKVIGIRGDMAILSERGQPDNVVTRQISALIWLCS